MVLSKGGIITPGTEKVHLAKEKATLLATLYSRALD
jgi:hypothetical protein